ncbi:MAG: PAS domain S-box protein [Deltaproteobacteria bacterium]|nr:PAS domain S-box protein [Deltaproteobacteria bacterium]
MPARMIDQLTRLRVPWIVADAKAVIVGHGPQVPAIFGREPDSELLGHSLHEILDSWDTATGLDAAYRAIRERGHWIGEFTTVIADAGAARPRWTTWRATAIDDDERDGDVLFVIDDRSELARTKFDLDRMTRCFQAISASSHDAIVILDQHGRINYYNDATRRIFGVHQMDLNGRTFYDLLTPEGYRDAYLRGLFDFSRAERPFEGGEFRVLAGRRRDGTEFPLELSVSTVRVENAWWALCVMRDLSDKVRVELEYHTILNAMRDGFFVADAQGRFLEVNNAYCRLLGYTLPELLRMKLNDIEEVAAEGEGFHYESIRRKGFSRYETRHRTRHDQWIDVEVTANYLDALGGRIVTLVRDITEKKAAEDALRKSEAHYRHLLESIPQKVFYKDRDSVYVTVNSSFASDFGMTPRDFVGKTDFDFFPAELAAKYRRDDARVMEGARGEAMTEHYTSGDRVLTVQSHKMPLFDPDGRAMGILGIFWDITERIEMEEELRRKHRETEQALEAAREADAMRTNFLANVSHELRTPLNAIKGLANVMAIETEMPTEKRLQYLATINNNSEVLLRMMNNLIEVARIESSPHAPKEMVFDLDPLLAALTQRFEIHAQAKGLEFRYKRAPRFPSLVIGDPIMIETVLNNLLDNAVKFTDRGHVAFSAVAMRAGVNRRNLRFVVDDTGIGIPAEDLGKIFQSFYQSDRSSTKRFRGSGLGLSIAMEFAKKMDGALHVESEVGRGSVFTFDVPVGIPPRE